MKKIAAFIISGFSLLIAIAIYTFFREPNLYLENVFAFLDLSQNINILKLELISIDLPQFVLYGLPDLLWMFSFNLFVLALWDFQLNLNSWFWIICVFIVGIGFEVLQSTQFVSGIFDYYDLLYLAIGFLAAFSFTFNKILRHAKRY